MLNALNQQLFLLLNASDTSSPLAILAARLLAELPVGMAIVLIVFAWRKQRERRVFTIRLLLTVSLAMGTAMAIRAVCYNPRPFVLGLGRMLLAHDATSSFPSLHATFLFSLALALFFLQKSRCAGLAMFFLGVIIAWARIFVGVHYPLDMVGAFITAAIAASVTCAIIKRTRSALPPA